MPGHQRRQPPRLGGDRRQRPAVGIRRRPLQRLEPPPEIRVAPPERVARLGERRQPRRQHPRPLRRRDDEHVREPRVHRQRRQHPPVVGQPPRPVERPEFAEQGPRLGEGRRRRRRQEGEPARVRRPPQREVEREPGQVRARDLRRRETRQPALLAPGPQPVAPPRRHPPRPPAALLRLGPGHALGDEPRHPRARIEPRPPRPAAVHHHPHVGDGQRGLRDRRRQHQPPPRRERRQRPPLLREGQPAMQRLHHHLRRQPRRQPRRHPPDLALPRQEDEHAALGLRDRGEHQVRHRLLEARAMPGAARPRPVEPARLHRKHPPFRGDDRRPAHQRRHRLGLERRRHDQQPQVRPQSPPHLEGQRQPEVCLQRPLVELVEDHAADAGQIRRRLKHPRQHPLGDDLDRAPRDRLSADAVADPPPDRLAEFLRQPLGGGPRRHPPRLQHQDPPAAGSRRARRQQGQRDPGGLARARRRLQHRPTRLVQGPDQSRQHRIDRQPGQGPAPQRRVRTAVP